MKSVVFIISFVILYGIVCENIKGSIILNRKTLEKIVPKFKAVLVKFDESYPYGDKQDVFKKVVEATLQQTEVLIGEVHISDFGEKENSDLGELYSVKKEHLPVYKLFLNGQVNDPLTYTGDIKSIESIKQFLVENSGLWFGLPGCLERYDEIIGDFVKSDRKVALKRAQDIKENLPKEDKPSALFYIKVMEKIIEKGFGFVENEIKRLKKLSDGKLSKAKKQQLDDRISILTSFKLNISRVKTEL